MEELQETPLAGRHRDRKALMAPFGGWNMPIQYEDGILAEHRWCREKAALFDICHMGEFLYRGDFAAGGLESVFTFSVASIPEGRSRYGFLLNERGGVIDDLIVFRLGRDEAMIVVNAATAKNDFSVIRSRLAKGAEFSDISAATGKLDPQGPLSREVMVDLLGGKVASIPYFRFLRMDVLGSPAIVSRTGYTGELGYEIFLPCGEDRRIVGQAPFGSPREAGGAGSAGPPAARDGIQPLRERHRRDGHPAGGGAFGIRPISTRSSSAETRS